MYKCLVCGNEYEKAQSLMMHVLRTHEMKKKEYYDKFLRKEGEGVCWCGVETRFIDVNVGYLGSCCNSHAQKKINSNHSQEQYDRHKKKVGEGICKVCGEPTNYRSYNEGYSETCGMSCARTLKWKIDPDYREKMKVVASETMSKTNKEILWKDDGFRERKVGIMKEINEQWKNPEHMDRMSKIFSDRFKGKPKSPEHTEKIRKMCSSDEERNRRSDLAVKRHIETPDGFGKGHYKTGWYYSEKNKKSIYHASSYELLAFKKLENDNNVVSYDRYKGFIEYFNPKDNKIHKYIPDLEVVYKGKSQNTIIEVKADWEVEDEVVLSKSFSARQKLGDDNYEVWSIKDLELEENEESCIENG